jgi:cell division septation protein DedD
MNLTNEERKRPNASKRTGWLATLGGAALLVAVGFGVGLVAGTAYEEPELVADHLSGKTTEVVLGPIGDGQPHESLDGASADDVAAAPPTAAEAEPDPVAVVDQPLPTPLGAGALEEPAAAPAAKPVAKLAPTSGGYSIQVGAFGSEATARQLASELGKRGYKAYVTREGGDVRFKVRVGPIASRSEAEQTATRLKTEHHLPTWILASGKS